MSVDPRLADPIILALAAKRRQAKRQVSDWRTSEGLYSLLQAAKALPRREDPWGLSDLDTTSGLGKLLAEARLQGGEHGA
jgi:hypothetical protein